MEKNNTINIAFSNFFILIYVWKYIKLKKELEKYHQQENNKL